MKRKEKRIEEQKQKRIELSSRGAISDKKRKEGQFAPAVLGFCFSRKGAEGKERKRKGKRAEKEREERTKRVRSLIDTALRVTGRTREHREREERTNQPQLHSNNGVVAIQQRINRPDAATGAATRARTTP
jgi:hypothetical protein